MSAGVRMQRPIPARNSDVVLVRFADTSARLGRLVAGAVGFVVDCNHGSGHFGWPAALHAASWQFMKEHPFGITSDPYASGIRSSFPKYCQKVAQVSIGTPVN